jgi:CRISPR-associated exonuclease Cas4
MDNPGEILSTLEHGLRATSISQTEQTLGDRSGYLGMSDLAMAITCQRKVVANKIKSVSTHYSLNDLLTLERGHWLEHGIETALRATGLGLIPQLEISVRHHNVPLTQSAQPGVNPHLGYPYLGLIWT